MQGGSEAEPHPVLCATEYTYNSPVGYPDHAHRNGLGGSFARHHVPGRSAACQGGYSALSVEHPASKSRHGSQGSGGSNWTADRAIQWARRWKRHRGAGGWESNADGGTPYTTARYGTGLQDCQ